MSLLLAACGTQAPAPTEEPQAENWWEVDAANSDSNNTVPPTSDGKDPNAAADDDKDDTTSPTGKYWSCEIDTATSSGSCTYNLNLPDTGAACTMEVQITQLAEVTNCADCSFAWDISTGVSTVTSEASDGCAAFSSYVEATFSFGQGSENVGSYQGVDFFSLYSGADAAWTVIEGGYSSVKNETLWTFGAK